MAYQKQTDGNHIARGTIESRAAIKRGIEGDRLLDLTIQRRAARQKTHVVNTTVRLVDLDVAQAMRTGVSIRDYKMARQAVARREAKRQGQYGSVR